MIEVAVPVVVALIAAAAAVGGPVVALWANHRVVKGKLDEQSVKLEEVRHNVSNDHRTNLRDDVDAALAGIERVETFLSQLGANATRLRRDVHVVMGRQADHEAASGLLVGALRESDRRILDELRRHHPQVPDYDDLTGDRIVDLEAGDGCPVTFLRRPAGRGVGK
jgi:hypothetical protein